MKPDSYARGYIHGIIAGIVLMYFVVVLIGHLSSNG